MKKILITQRVDFISSYSEHRDALDQRWVSLLLAAELLPVLVANNFDSVSYMLANDHFDGLLLSGGNSLAAYGGTSPTRDDVERYLLEWAIRQQTPVLGVCRGMQLIQDYYQIPLEPVADHVGVAKQLCVTGDDPVAQIFRSLRSVTVFRSAGSYLNHSPLKTVAKTSEDAIMATQHESLPIFGIMWHPEREQQMIDRHIEYLKLIFGCSH